MIYIINLILKLIKQTLKNSVIFEIGLSRTAHKLTFSRISIFSISLLSQLLQSDRLRYS